MSNDSDNMTNQTPDDDHVGYRNPPKRHRFKPGQSGNKRGRPKARRNHATIMRDIAFEKHWIKDEDGQRRQVTTLELMIRAFRSHVADGHPGAGKAYDAWCARYRPQQGKGGYLVVPSEVTEEEFIALYGGNLSGSSLYDDLQKPLEDSDGSETKS